jgi:hypothetical protein
MQMWHKQRIGTEADWAASRRSHIASMPRWRFYIGRALDCGPDDYMIALHWRKYLDAGEGELIYRKWIVLRLRFRLNIDRR